MTPLYWLTERPALHRTAIALALVTWGAIAIMASREPRGAQGEDANEQCITTLVGPLG
jgi:hypothetical protein